MPRQGRCGASGLAGLPPDEHRRGDKCLEAKVFVGLFSPTRNAQRVKAPVLLFHGTNDLNVGVAGWRLMAGKLRDAGKSVEFVEFKKLDHRLDHSQVRAARLTESGAFLHKSLGM